MLMDRLYRKRILLIESLIQNLVLGYISHKIPHVAYSLVFYTRREGPMIDHWYFRTGAVGEDVQRNFL